MFGCGIMSSCGSTGSEQKRRWFAREPGPRDEREPDYRFSLANERTLLAWLRTALALVAGGVAVLELVRRSLGSGTGREAVGLALLALALLIALTSYRRWRFNERALRRGEPLPFSLLPRLVTVGLTLIIAVIIGFVAVGL